MENARRRRLSEFRVACSPEHIVVPATVGVRMSRRQGGSKFRGDWEAVDSR